MGYMILTDRLNERSVLFCTTSDRPLNHEAFRGPDCFEQAQDFLRWLGCDPRDMEALALKGYVDGPLESFGRPDGFKPWYPALDHAHTAWYRLAFDPKTDEFVGTHSVRVAS